MALPSYEELTAEEALPSYDELTKEELPSYEELTVDAPQEPPVAEEEVPAPAPVSQTPLPLQQQEPWQLEKAADQLSQESSRLAKESIQVSEDADRFDPLTRTFPPQSSEQMDPLTRAFPQPLQQSEEAANLHREAVQKANEAASLRGVAAEKEKVRIQREKTFGVQFRPPAAPDSLFASIGGRATSRTLNALAAVTNLFGAKETSTGLRQTAQRAEEIAQGVPGWKGGIGRGLGEIAFLGPGLTLPGLPAVAVGTAQSLAAAQSEAKTAKEAELKSLGVTDAAVIEKASNEAANKAALKAAALTPAYLIPGFAAAKAIGRATEKSSTLIRAASQFGGAAATNIGTGALIRSAAGESAVPNLEQLTTDIGLSGFQAASEFGRTAKAAADEVPPRPDIEQPTTRPPEELAPNAGSETPEPGGILFVDPEAAQKVLEESKGAIIQQIADSNGVKYDGPTELPGNPHQFTDQRTGSTFIVLGGVTPEKVQAKVDKIDQSYGLEPRERKLGPGAANIEEPFTNAEPVGAWNAKVDEQRAARGLEPLASEARKADQTTWDDAEQRFTENPNYGRDLVDQINEGKKESVSDTEQAAILREMLGLREQRDQATQRAFDEATYSPEERAAFLEEAKAADERLERTEEADRKSGTAQGRALRIRRLMAYEDFTLAGLMGKARRAKGEEPTPAETEVLKTKADRFQKAKEKFEQRTEEAEAGQPVDEAIRAIEAEAAKDPEFTPEVRSLADRIVSRLEKAANSARTRLRGLMSQLGSAPDVTKAPALIKELAIIAASDITRGAVKFGQWATKMVKDFGEKVKPYLSDAWKQADKDIDAQVSGTRTKKPKEVKAAVTKEDAAAVAEQMGAEIKSKGGTLADRRTDIQKLVETFVRGGIKKRDPLVDAVHEVLKGIDPAVTRRQTMDLISGYGDFKKLNPDAVKAEVRDLKQQLQLAAKIEDVLASTPLKRSGVERQPLSDEGRALTKKLNDLSRELGIKVTDPATQLKSILAALETRLTNRIKDLKAEIAKGQKTVRTKTPTPTNDKINALRAELEQVQAQHEAAFGKEARKLTDEQKIRALKTRMQNRVKELETRIKNQDFGPRPKRAPLDISKDPEAVKAKAEMERVKKEFQEQQFKWQRANRNLGEKFLDTVSDVMAAPRTLKSAFDISAPFRQGVVFSFSDLLFKPARFFRQFRQMLASGRSRKRFEEEQAEIALRDNSRNGIYDRSGLYLADLGEKQTLREEHMLSNLAEKVPGVEQSNRAYTTFLNKQRADSMDAFVDAMGGPDVVTPEQTKFLAQAINDFTGRGNVPESWGQAMNVLAKFLFSPRNLVSRLNILTLRPIFRGVVRGPAVGAKARALVALQYGKTAAALLAFYGLAKAVGAMTDEDVKIEKDPRSSDFGKLKIGNTRIDPMGGMQQLAVLAARTLTGKQKPKQGGLAPINASTFGNFVRSKLHPVLGSFIDWRTGKNVIGEKVTGKDAALGLITPLSVSEDVKDVYKQHGPVKGTVFELLNLMGMSMQNYR